MKPPFLTPIHGKRYRRNPVEGADAFEENAAEPFRTQEDYGRYYEFWGKSEKPKKEKKDA